MKITGQCHCGQISFSAQADPERVVACHCTDCQKFSGSPFRTTLPVPAENISFTGTPKQYIKTADSGKRRAQGFCPNCGTQIYACEPENPTTFNLRLGCVNERAQLPPKVQFWTCSAMSWLQDLPGVKAHVKGPDSPLIAK
jgi:hypothetical protein